MPAFYSLWECHRRLVALIDGACSPDTAVVLGYRTKEALVDRDPRSDELLKPVLRGRDIRRYKADWAGYWLIDTHNGYEGVPAIDVDEYPAIKEHLESYYPRLERRYDQDRTPYNLRKIALTAY